VTRRDKLRAAAIAAVVALGAVSILALPLDSETASRIALGVTTAVVMLVRGPKDAPPALALAVLCEVGAQLAR
jgi:hypothetical protein